jgi:hypothetical protein
LTDFTVLNEAKPDGCEFYIQLVKNKKNKMTDRLSQLQKIAKDR